MQILVPAGVQEKFVSCSLIKAANPFGCSVDPFLNCPLMKIPQVQGVNSASGVATSSFGNAIFLTKSFFESD